MNEGSTSIKEQALAKMLEEMNKPHDETVDDVHNFLCEQEDDELFTAILVEGKTIQNALNYLVAEARKNRRFRITDAEGYRIIKQYFLGSETEVASAGRVSQRPIQSESPQEQEEKPVVKAVKHAAHKKTDNGLNLSIFDFISEPIEVDDEEDYELSDSDD